MLTVNQALPSFRVLGVRPFANDLQDDPFEWLDEASFPDRWKIVVFYPKDFTFVCPTELAAFARLAPEFGERDAVVMAGSPDNEFVKLAWRRQHPDLASLALWQFADLGCVFARALGVFDEKALAPLRATFIVDPDNVVQHVYVTNGNVGRSADDTLRVLDALQTEGLCACDRPVGAPILVAVG